MTDRSIRTPAITGRDPLVLRPGGRSIPWPPKDGRLSDDARRALAFAQDEAARLDHNHVSPVHLLAGLAGEPDCAAARTLAAFGASAERTRAALEATMGRGAQHIAVGDITITPRAQRVIDMARYESQRLGHAATGTEHLLLALIYEKESFTVRLLDALKVDPEKVRERTLAAMRVPSSYRAAEHADLNDGPYERFDEESRQVLAFAREEAMRLGHYWIGDDHILLGLVRAAANSAADQAFRHTIAKLGITVERLREEVAKIQPPREPRASTPVMKFTGNTKLIIELALQAAGEGAPVRPRHLLAALGTARNSFATYLLGRFGATPADLRFGAERTDDPPSQ